MLMLRRVIQQSDRLGKLGYNVRVVMRRVFFRLSLLVFGDSSMFRFLKSLNHHLHYALVHLMKHTHTRVPYLNQPMLVVVSFLSRLLLCLHPRIGNFRSRNGAQRCQRLLGHLLRIRDSARRFLIKYSSIAVKKDVEGSTVQTCSLVAEVL